MPISVGNRDGPLSSADQEAIMIKRLLTVITPDGTEVIIRTAEQLQRILDSMTPEQLEDWKRKYRYAPILNYTDNPNYTGTAADLR